MILARLYTVTTERTRSVHTFLSWLQRSAAVEALAIQLGGGEVRRRQGATKCSSILCHQTAQKRDVHQDYNMSKLLLLIASQSQKSPLLRLLRPLSILSSASHSVPSPCLYSIEMGWIQRRWAVGWGAWEERSWVGSWGGRRRGRRFGRGRS